jgi:hypothetical protein
MCPVCIAAAALVAAKAASIGGLTALIIQKSYAAKKTQPKINQKENPNGQ